MTTTLPNIQLILDYEVFFGVPPPNDRISLIKQISKNHLLTEIAALNYRLKPKDKLHRDYTLETQIKELRYFAQTDDLFNIYYDVLRRYIKNKANQPNIFNRQACVFAIEEIINSTDMQTQENFVMSRIEVWESILKYLLAVNYTITQIKEEKDSHNVSFESLNPKLLPLLELSVNTDPFFTPYRGYKLINFFLERPHFESEVKSYFLEKYNISPDHFVFQLLHLFMANNTGKADRDFFYHPMEQDQDIYDKLSIHIPNKETYKLLNVRKSPFIKIDSLKYIIADNSFLLDKAYSQFLNDFWFDRIKLLKDDKGKPKFSIDFYRSEFGYFFEHYIAEIFRESFKYYKHSNLLLFDELKVNSSQGQIEIADIYFRYNNKILLGQVKSASIYDPEKYGGNIESLYKNDRNKFFENFGVNQIVKSLETMDTYIQKIDAKFPKGHTYTVYPCIVFNDKALQTPLMADIFNKRFKELISNFSIKKVLIKPITLLHVGDLERLEDSLSKNPKEIWDLLQFNHANPKFIPPFYITINRNWNNRQYASRVLEIFKKLIPKGDSAGNLNDLKT